MKWFIIAFAVALSMAFMNKNEAVPNNPVVVTNPTEIQVSGFQKQLNKMVWPWNWYTYIGEPNDYVHQFDEGWYEYDEDQYPNCTIPLGYIRCEVKCKGDAWIEGRPDFTTIQAIRYRQ